ncbi:MAG: dipeptidase [Prolixibacteraceae bacterium]|nr:dipeptidase [Prolixibacteraceae bacterium]
MKRTALLLIVLIVVAGCNNFEKIHSEALVIDTHTDTPMLMVNEWFDLSKRHSPPDFRVDIPRLKEGEVDAIFFALFTGQKERTTENYLAVYNLAHQMLDSTLTGISRNSDKVALATSSSGIEEISKKGKTAICLGMENGFPIAKDLSRIDEFYDLGVRYITLCHSSNNDICDSSTDPTGPEHNGVSEFGKEVITRMNQLGMIIDVSHISDDSFFDVIKYSKAPVIASHSSVRSICNHPRNLSDEMIKQLAQNGGVIQICILGMYIREADTTSTNYIKREELRKKYNNWQYANDDERKAAWAEYDSINRVFPVELPTVAEAVDHIDYVVNLVGIDHVGIGSDFDGGGGLADCRDVSEFPNITRELVNRGYSLKDIEKIWGGNFLRVFKEVEAVAAKNN